MLKLCRSIVSHHAKIFQNKLCERSWDIRLNNLPLAWKVDFLRKLTNTTTVYLLCPIILESLKKVLSVGQITRYKVLQFWAKLGTNYRFTLKGDFFLKDWLMLILSTSCAYKNTTMFRKKIIKLDLWSSTRLHASFLGKLA